MFWSHYHTNIIHFQFNLNISIMFKALFLSIKSCALKTVIKERQDKKKSTTQIMQQQIITKRNIEVFPKL